MGSALVQKARVRANPTNDSVCGVKVQAVEFAQLWASYPDSASFVDPFLASEGAGGAAFQIEVCLCSSSSCSGVSRLVMAQTRKNLAMIALIESVLHRHQRCCQTKLMNIRS
jgi:hypothetical protein